MVLLVAPLFCQSFYWFCSALNSCSSAASCRPSPSCCFPCPSIFPYTAPKMSCRVSLLDISPRKPLWRQCLTKSSCLISLHVLNVSVPPGNLMSTSGFSSSTTVLMYSRKVDLCSCAERRRRENELSGIMLSFVVARILVFQKACSLRSLTSLAFLLKWCPLDLQIP